MVCGAHIKTGSENTFIGGPTVQVAFVLDIEGWMHTGLEALGLLAAGGALVLAACAGAAAFFGALAIGGVMFAGMSLLGDLGDRLGPGYRDLLQGVAGMALLGLGPKMAKGIKPPQFKPGFSEADILAIPKGSRLMSKGNLDKYGIGQKDGTSFIAPRHEIDQLLARTKGNPRALEDALGLPKNFFESGGELVRVDLPKPRDMNLRIPSGNETGANESWIPGGKLPEGTSEAVIDAGGLKTSDLDWKILTF